MSDKPFMTVKNAKGETVELELVDTVDVDNSKYVILSPIGAEEAHAYRVENKHGKNEYESIGSGSEFKKVLEKYNENNQ